MFLIPQSSGPDLRKALQERFSLMVHMATPLRLPGFPSFCGGLSGFAGKTPACYNHCMT